MKLEQGFRFAHPVLSASSDDYRTGSFSCDIEVTENVETGAVHLVVGSTLDETCIAILVATGKAIFGLYVICLDTYYIDFIPAEIGLATVSIPPSTLRGNVILRPLILVKADSVDIPRSSVNSEFNEPSRGLIAGDVVAVADDVQFEAGFEKLLPMESIFRLASDSDIKNSGFALNPDEEAVKIRLSPAMFDSVSILRGNPTTRNLLISALYLPVLMEVLSNFPDCPHSERRWCRTLEAKCREMGLKLDGQDKARVAQTLLDYPLALIRPAVEGMTA